MSNQRALAADLQNSPIGKLQVDVNVFNPPPQQAQEQEQRALTQAEAEKQSQIRAPRRASKFIGSLPRRYDETTPFHNRNSERATIANAIAQKTRLITIWGRAGSGKTGLACKVLDELEKASGSLDGMVYLSAGGAAKEISMQRIMTDFDKILLEDTLNYDPQTPSAQKAALLTNILRDGHYVLLLDNLETMQDATTHAVTDEEVQALINEVLQRGGLTIIITTRLPLKLDVLLKSYEIGVPLDEGLPEHEAIDFLRSLDRSSRLPPEDAPLQTLVERTRGFPRALEAAMGWLYNTETGTLAELLADETLFGGEVAAHIVQKAIETLPSVYLRIMEGLAALGQPVKQPALEYLLAPYLDMDQVKLAEALDRLAGARFVTFNRLSRTYSLHSLDREYCYNSIPLGTSNDVPKCDLWEDWLLEENDEVPNESDITPLPYTRYALNHRAAEFYEAQRKPREEWKTIDDLAPQLAEFEYRLQTQDFDTATELLLQFDLEYLQLWGEYHLIVKLHEQLVDKVKDFNLKGQCLNSLGTAYFRLAHVEQSIKYFEQALTIAVELSHRSGESSALGNLAIVYTSLGNFEEGIALCKKGIEIAHDLGDLNHESTHLGNVGLAYTSLGDYEEGIALYKKALEMAYDIHDRLAQCINLGNLGYAQTKNGAIILGKDNLKKAVHLAETIGSPVLKSIYSIDLSYVHAMEGNFSGAQAVINIARQYDASDYNHYAAALHGVILLKLKETDKTRAAFEDAIHFATGILENSPKYFKALYSRALAHAGLVVCGQDTLEKARKDYQVAMDVCSAAGVVQEQRQMLVWLIECEGGEQLVSLQDILDGI